MSPMPPPQGRLLLSYPRTEWMLDYAGLSAEINMHEPPTISGTLLGPYGGEISFKLPVIDSMEKVYGREEALEIVRAEFKAHGFDIFLKGEECSSTSSESSSD